MSVVETAHGKLFEEQEEGADLTQLSVVALVDVDREREPVPGIAQNLPGNRLITFYPSRDYAYGGTVFVDLRYDGEELAHSKFSIRPLPTLVHGFAANQLLIPLQGIEVFLPDLNRTAISNDDGSWNFGFGEPAELRIAPGRYRALFNPKRKNERFGMVERFVEIQAGLGYAGTVLVPELNRAEPFRHIASNQVAVASLASGDLQLDLHEASFVFPDGQPEGDVHVQLLAGSQVGHVHVDGARPDWVFGIQPAGVHVQGPIGIRIVLPKLDDSHAYVAGLPEHMLLVGLDAKSLQIAPMGVVRLEPGTHSVVSAGPVHLSRLDYIGLAITAATPQALGQYAAGEIDLTALTAVIGASP